MHTKTKLRRVDPATTTKDYTEGQKEFLRAVDNYRTRTCRQFVTPVECHDIMVSLGYQRVGVSA